MIISADYTRRLIKTGLARLKEEDTYEENGKKYTAVERLDILRTDYSNLDEDEDYVEYFPDNLYINPRPVDDLRILGFTKMRELLRINNKKHRWVDKLCDCKTLVIISRKGGHAVYAEQDDPKKKYHIHKHHSGYKIRDDIAN